MALKAGTSRSFFSPKLPKIGVLTTILFSSTLSFLTSSIAHANCNVIPPSTAFACVRGPMGCSGTPFASPEQLVELRPTPCDLQSRTLRVDPADASSACVAASGAVVSVILKPLNGPVSAVVRAASCTPALEAEVATWATRLAPGGGTAICEADPALAVRRFDLGDGASECRLDMTFPDTTAIAEPTTGLAAPYVGPAVLVVTRSEDPLPLLLDQQTCSDSVGAILMSGCIDKLLENDGSCSLADTSKSRLVSHFTALPPSNDFAALCSTRGDATSSCDDSVSPDLHFALDTAGNAMIPIDWRGVRPLPPSGFPPATVVGLTTTVAKESGSASVLALSGPQQVRSMTADGLLLPAPFNPILDPTDTSQAAFTGTTDGPFGVLFFRRLSEAGTPDFDLSYLLTANGGPGVMRGADAAPGASEFEAFTEGRVPLGGLCRTSEFFCFVPDETIDDVEINADEDRSDLAVVTVRSLITGRLSPIGGEVSGGGFADGRAAALVFRPPFRTVAVAADDANLAFLEPETWEGALDANGNGDVGGTNLRVYRVDAGGNASEIAAAAAQTLLGLPLLAVDPEPVLFEGANGPTSSSLRGDPVIVAGDLVYFRASEAANTPRKTVRLDLDPDGALPSGPGFAPDVTAAGDVFVFESDASDLVDGDKNKDSDVFLHDRSTGTTSLGSVRYADPPPKRPLCEGRLIKGRSASVEPAIAADGASFCYETLANNLVKPDRNDTWDIVVQDRDTCVTERVSVTEEGDESDAASHGCDIAAGGQLVVFASLAALVSTDTNGGSDIYLRDRNADTTALISLDESGQLPGESQDATISSDGACVAFTNSIGGASHVYLRDLAAGETLAVGEGSNPDLGGDCSRIAFEAATGDVVVMDLTSGLTEIVSHGSDFGAGPLPSFEPSLSGDGRSVSYTTANAFLPSDDNGVEDVHQVDLRTRLVRLIDEGADGSTSSILSGDGFTAGYSGTSDDPQGVFVREPDGDALADFSGDGAIDDDVLFILDAASIPPALHYVGPASQAAVAGGRLAYVAGETNRALLQGCPSCPIEDLGVDARAVALSQDVVCARTLPDDVLACRTISGAGPLRPIVDTLGNPVAVSAFAVAGTRVAFLQPGMAAGVLGVIEVASDESISTAISDEPARDFVLGESGVVGWTICEGDIGFDLNGDGFEAEDCVLHTNRPGSTEAVNSLEILTDCFTDACNPKFPFLVLGDVVRFLTRECRDGGDCEDLGVINDRCDKDGDGDCDGVVVQNLDTRLEELLVLGAADDSGASNPLGNPNLGGFGSVILAGAVYPDFDNDGILGLSDSCPNVPNLLQLDFDGDGIGDACDRFSCGDGDVDESEFCDPAASGPDCNDDCTPRVELDITENAINPDQQGNVPAIIFASSVLNLDQVSQAGLPAKMIDTETILFAAFRDGACAPSSAGTAHDLGHFDTYQSHLIDKNGDGRPDLQVHLEVVGSGLDSDTTEACVTGTFSAPLGEFGTATFEAIDEVNVK